MNTIRLWATGICYCAVVCSVLFMLLPEGANTKLYKMLGGLVFLTCLISPLLSLRGIDITLDMEGSAAQMEESKVRAEEIADELAYSKSEENIKGIVAQKLEGVGVVPQQIGVNIHNNEEDNISYIVATVTLSPNDRASETAVQSLLKKELDIECTINYGMEDVKQ